MAIFGAQDASGASFFDGIYDVLCTYTFFYSKNCNVKKHQKITKKKLISCWSLAFLGSRPLPQTDPSQGPLLTAFAMFFAIEQKRAAFCLRNRLAPVAADPGKLTGRGAAGVKGEVWGAKRKHLLAISYPLLSPTAAKSLKYMTHQGGFDSLLRSSLLRSFLLSPNRIRYGWLWLLLSPTAAKPLKYIAHKGGFGSTKVLLAPSFSRLCCLIFFLPPTVSDTVGGPGGARASDLKAPSLSWIA